MVAKIEETIIIKVPPEDVFSFVDEPTSLELVWQNLVDVRDVKRLPNGGTYFKASYRMVGFRLPIESTDIEWEENKRVVTKTGGGVESTITMTFEPEGEWKTKLTIIAEYEMPIPLVGRIAEGIVAKMNKTDLVYFLNYLKSKYDYRPE